MAAPTPQTTPTRDEAVPMDDVEIKQRILGALDDYRDAGPEDGESWQSWYYAAFDLASEKIAGLLDMLASAPAPARGGVDAVREACAQAAEGPEYWPYPKQPGDVLTYRGTKDGNWLAVKPPFKLDPYSQGRADAAAAVRALSPAATSGSEAGGSWIDAEHVVNSEPVLKVYTACEWSDLNEDGQVWIQAIVDETRARVCAAIVVMLEAERANGSTDETGDVGFAAGAYDRLRSFVRSKTR